MHFTNILTEAKGEESTDRSSNVISSSFTSTGLLDVAGASAWLPSTTFSLNFNEFSLKKREAMK